MSLKAKPFKQGSLTVISGPVGSEKTEELESFLDASVDSGYKTENNILVFRHPDDEKNPEQIGKHKTIITENVDDIYNKIISDTSTIIIAGAPHYQDSRIIDLTDAMVRSNRNVIVSGLNLNSKGQPYKKMPDFMALADRVILAKAICSYHNCLNFEANRSQKNENQYNPVCTHHYHHDCPPISRQLVGSLECFVGPMFGGKSKKWKRELSKLDNKGLDYVVFKWIGDDRYGEDGKEKKKIFDPGNVTLHNDEKVPSVMVNTANDIKEYLSAHPHIKNSFIDELQFIQGIYDLIFEYQPKGHKFWGTGLPRGFNRKEFGDVPRLMCLANRVHMNHALCVKCGDPATENQRMKEIAEVVYEAEDGDPLVMPGGAKKRGDKFFYQARCLDHWVLQGEPKSEFKLDKFSWD